MPTKSLDLDDNHRPSSNHSTFTPEDSQERNTVAVTPSESHSNVSSSPTVRAHPFLSEEDVLLYLENSPDFFKKYTQILSLMKLPSSHAQDNILSFQENRIERLEAHVRHLELERQSYQATFQANQERLHRVHAAVYSLAAVPTFDEFCAFLTTDLAPLLEVDAIGIAFEIQPQTESMIAPILTQEAFTALPYGTLKTLFHQQRFALFSEREGSPLIFGENASHIKSQALAQFSLDRVSYNAVIALGSYEPDFFHPEQALDLLEFLVDMIELYFQKWLITFLLA